MGERGGELATWAHVSRGQCRAIVLLLLLLCAHFARTIYIQKAKRFNFFRYGGIIFVFFSPFAVTPYFVTFSRSLLDFYTCVKKSPIGFSEREDPKWQRSTIMRALS